VDFYQVDYIFLALVCVTAIVCFCLSQLCYVATFTNLLHCLKENWSQPAKQIVRRYRQRQQRQQQALAEFSGSSGDSLVLTRSFQRHECGYPDCGKQFCHKRHLRRHQTQKHGRIPKRVLALRRVYTRLDDMNTQQSFDSNGINYLVNPYVIFRSFVTYAKGTNVFTFVGLFVCL